MHFGVLSICRDDHGEHDDRGESEVVEGEFARRVEDIVSSS
jgi:hypothetical protein